MAEKVGAAQTDLVDLLGGGALGKRSVELAKFLTPEREEFDPAIAAMKFFSNMAAQASKPGATVIGSAAGAVKPVVDDYTAMLQRNRKLAAAQGPLAVSLYDKLKGTTKKNEYIDLTKTDDPDTLQDDRIVKLTETQFANAGTNIISLASMTAGVDANNKKLDNFNKLSGNYKKERTVDKYQKLRSTWQKINVAYNEAYNPKTVNPQVSDVSMIFNYMKMLDPGSTVREGEYATAKNTAGIEQGLRNSLNAALGQGFLSDSQRADFRRVAWKLLNAEAGNVEKVNKQFEAIGKDYNLDVENFLDKTINEYGLLKEDPEDGIIKWTAKDLTSGVNLITVPSNADLANMEVYPNAGSFIEFLEAPNVINNPDNLAKIYNAQYDRVGDPDMIKELIENMDKTDEFKAYLVQELIKIDKAKNEDNTNFDFLKELYPLPTTRPTT